LKRATDPRTARLGRAVRRGRRARSFAAPAGRRMPPRGQTEPQERRSMKAGVDLPLRGLRLQPAHHRSGAAPGHAIGPGKSPGLTGGAAHRRKGPTREDRSRRPAAPSATRSDFARRTLWLNPGPVNPGDGLDIGNGPSVSSQVRASRSDAGPLRPASEHAIARGLDHSPRRSRASRRPTGGCASGRTGGGARIRSCRSADVISPVHCPRNSMGIPNRAHPSRLSCRTKGAYRIGATSPA
jgi:hypothetical protein